MQEIDGRIEYWLDYLRRYIITLNKIAKFKLAIILVGTQKDKLPLLFSHHPLLEQQRLVKQRMNDIQLLFSKYQQLISDAIIVSGKKIEGIEALIHKIQEHSAKIIHSRQLLLPTTVVSIISFLH